MRNANSNTNEMPQVLLWGGGSQARLVAEMLNEGSHGDPKIIFDKSLHSLHFDSKALFINHIETLHPKLSEITHFVVCIGSEYGFARHTIAGHLEKLKLKPISLIHSSAFIDASSCIGSGSQVMPGAIVHKFTQIGDQCILNTGACIDHECFIGNGVHVMGSAAVAGCVTIHDYATIGTNATLLPKIQIGEGAFVAAGAVVTKSVEPYTVVAGVPAVEIRKTSPYCDESPLIELLSKSKNQLSK